MLAFHSAGRAGTRVSVPGDILGCGYSIATMSRRVGRLCKRTVLPASIRRCH